LSLYKLSIFSILFISEILVESLASLLNHCSDIKDIVHRIAKIVITTMSSTNVNAFLFIIIIN
jgi:hypothetical protein